MSRRDVLIVGAGAIGTFLAVRLQLAGYEVGVLARGERLEHVREHGLRLVGSQELTTRDVELSDDAQTLLPADFVILCTNAGGLENVVSSIGPYIESSTTLVTVQNGVDAPVLVADQVPQAGVIAARVHGFFEMEQGGVRHVGIEPSLTFGAIAPEARPASVRLEALLSNAGITVTRSDEILRELWEKFMLSAPLGGVGTALGVPAGSILHSAEGEQMLRGAMVEIRKLASGRGIDLPQDCVDQRIEFVRTFPADATTSLQRDLEAGRPSEYDALIGAVLRIADEDERDVPVFALVAEMIKERNLTA